MARELLPGVWADNLATGARETRFLKTAVDEVRWRTGVHVARSQQEGEAGRTNCTDAHTREREKNKC